MLKTLVLNACIERLCRIVMLKTLVFNGYVKNDCIKRLYQMIMLKRLYQIIMLKTII